MFGEGGCVVLVDPREIGRKIPMDRAVPVVNREEIKKFCKLCFARGHGGDTLRGGRFLGGGCWPSMRERAGLGRSDFCSGLLLDKREGHPLFGESHGPLPLVPTVQGFPSREHTFRCVDLIYLQYLSEKRFL